MVVVTVKCPLCGRKREIKAGEIPEGQHPLCDNDGMPMIPEKAEAESVGVPEQTKKEGMRTQEEIVTRIEERKPDDPLNFEWLEYIVYLDYEHVKPYIKEDVTEEQWNEEPVPFTEEQLLERMKEYMSFAWDKANNCRGISATRSILHYIAWTWLLGDGFHETVEKAYAENYEFYGKAILILICDKYGFEKEDDGVRTNTG